MCYDRLDTLFIKNPLTTVNGTVKRQIIGSIILIEKEQEIMQACRYTILITATILITTQARHLLTILCVMMGLLLYFLKIL